MGNGVAAAGFVNSTTFSTADYSNGTGVILAFMLVPGPTAPTGSSPDFASGPIISNSILPLTFDALTVTNGIDNDTSSFQVPTTDVAGLPGLNGYSHIPLFLADNFDFSLLPTIAGDYEYRISLLDASGNGYEIVAPFAVVPEPASLTLLGSARIWRNPPSPQSGRWQAAITEAKTFETQLIGPPGAVPVSKVARFAEPNRRR
jgi:hypothetical protein